MNKLLPWLITLAILSCMTGSLVMPSLPQPAGEGHLTIPGDAPVWDVCSAPPSLLPAMCDRFPLLRQAPEFIKKSEKLVETWMPGIVPREIGGKGSLIDGILVKTAPHFL